MLDQHGFEMEAVVEGFRILEAVAIQPVCFVINRVTIHLEEPNVDVELAAVRIMIILV